MTEEIETTVPEEPTPSEALTGDAAPAPDADATHEADAPAQPGLPRRDPFEGALPPGYDWPTHGGYLGCLFGVMLSCILVGFLGSTLFTFFHSGFIAYGPLFALVTFLSPLVAVVALGRVGWLLGKRFFREYPRPTRGVDELVLPYTVEELDLLESADAEDERDESAGDGHELGEVRETPSGMRGE